MTTSNSSNLIQLGDYVIIQRQKYTKLQKFANLDSTAMLGKEQLELRGLLDQPYSCTFKMCPKEHTKRRHGQRQHTLQLCSETELRNVRDVVVISESGADNRNIRDDGESQALGAEEIELLRENCNESSKIIEKIVENSKTFNEKTAYSQEKYLKKKEKKYFEYVQIHRPTIRLITDIYFRTDAEKIMGIRMDTLSQILSYSGVSGYGNYLLYESGTNGLLPASFLNSIGSNTEAKLVHLHPGNVPQKQALLALNLPDEQLERCISVNIYSVLREFYKSQQISIEEDLKPVAEVETTEPCCKKQKLNEVEIERDTTMDLISNDITTADTVSTIITESTTPKAPQKQWEIENKRACKLFQTKFDSLVVASREHPANILNTLLPFVKPSRPIVVFSLCKEVLMDLYIDLKTNSKVTNLHLIGNWMRMYQILPNRTHPEVNMSGGNGFLLCGFTVS